MGRGDTARAKQVVPLPDGACYLAVLDMLAGVPPVCMQVTCLVVEICSSTSEDSDRGLMDPIGKVVFLGNYSPGRFLRARCSQGRGGYLVVPSLVAITQQVLK